MYRLIIVDDEYLFRKKLIGMIDWAFYGFEVAGVFGSGQKAIDFLKDNNVDIIISDIRMNRVSGLDIVKYVHDNLPYIKVILISGYQDFEYAKAAINYGVSDYLTKPVGKESVIKTLEKIKNELEKERNRFFSYLAVRQAFIDLMHNGETQISQQNLLSAGIQIQFDNTKYMLCVAEIQNFEEYISTYPYGKEGLYNTICYIITREYNGIYFSVLNVKENSIIIAAIKDNTEQELFEKEAGKALERAIGELSNILKINMSEKRTEFSKSASEFGGIYFEMVKNEKDEKEHSESAVEKAIKYMNENYQKDICQDDIASYVGLSVYHFSRIFKSATNEKFIDYLTKLRMENACRLLVSGDEKISEIGKMVGYINYSTFHRVFKAYTGYAPGEYRTIHKG